MTPTDLRNAVATIIHAQREGNAASVDIAAAVVGLVGKACAEVAAKGTDVVNYAMPGPGPFTVVLSSQPLAAILTLTGANADG